MLRDSTLDAAGTEHLKLFSVEYETGNQKSLFVCAAQFTREELRYKCHYAIFEDNMGSCHILGGGRIIGMMEAGWSAR
ncbi:hypothetical protein TNCV_2860591 [Trichonephila clavipes]|nr:hypothetical protein TNCV_2860591 [Trichonephila clavipes]